MAPIQNKTSSSSSSNSSYSVHRSGSNHDSTPRRSHESFSDSAWESFLPVTRRGRFFHDSFFENTRSHFDDAVRDALSRWGDDTDFLTDSWHDTSSPRLSNLSRYRQMRSRNLDEENLAVTVTSDNNVHKIVLDVHDFSDGNLKVKVVGERELLVEGCTDKKRDRASSSASTQKFSRRFTLPEETDVGAIDSVMSSDGILTITAPKVGRIGGATSQSKSNSFSSSSSSKLQDAREPCECEKCNPKLQTRENLCHKNVEQSQSFSDIRDRSEQGENRSDSAKNVNSYTQEEKKSSTNVDSSSQRLSDRMSQDVPIRAFFNSRPITRRGRFFDDSFFEDTRGDYRTAIQDILSKWGERSPNMDDLTSYRNLRTRDLREDNQAVRSIEDEFQYKFVVDVHDFMKDGEINVKAVDDQELVVEGHVETHEGGSKSIKRFSKRFLLPDDVHLESVSSVMSSDGVLTIIAPKKNAVTSMKEIHTPVCTQKIENNAENYESMSKNNAETYENMSENNAETYENMSGNNAGTYESMSANNAETYENMSENNAETHGNIAECNVQTSAENQINEKASMMDTKCGNETEYKDRGIRGSSTCSSGLDTSSTQEEEGGGATLHSSVCSKIFKAETSEETNAATGGHNISIHVDTSEEDLDNDNRNICDKTMKDIEADEKSMRGRLMEDLDIDQRSTRGRSIDDFDADIRSVRERSMESRERRAGSTRINREFDFEEDEDDDINFQESSRHSDVTEKKLCSILKTPDMYYQEGEQRNSRERSYIGEEPMDVDRRTPNRDPKRNVPYAPLSPDSKRSLPISRKGHFYIDAFFNDFQENFKTAINDVLLKFNEKSAKTDNITAYRNLRLRDPKLENQAFHIQEDQGAHKVVLDVKDFVNGDIEASVYGEKELVVEGRAERCNGSSKTTLSFLRRFPLPENLDTDAITVVMSSDGVLTVVTPWKGFSGLSAIKNILSTEDRPIFEKHSDFDRHWDESDWGSSSSSSKGPDDFLTRSLNSRIRSRYHHTNDDMF